MKNLKKFFLLTSILVFCTFSNACVEKCLQCDPSGNICFACGGSSQANVFGQCLDNKIDKCVIYGPSEECFSCQPTFILKENSCEKSFSGCMNQGNNAECFECGFGLKREGTNCKGVINCAEPSQKCNKCAEGYKLQENKCVDISAGCKTIRPKDGLCSECKQGFFMSGYKCYQQIYHDDRCYIKQKKDSCQFCKSGFTLYDGQCLLTKEIKDIQSGVKTLKDYTKVYKAAEKTTTTITTTTTTLNTNNNANKSQNGIGSMTECQVPDTSKPNTCLICKYGWYPVTQGCGAVSPFCQSHNVQTGACFACKYGLALNQGKCIDINCLSEGNGKCNTCKPNFKTNSNGVCEQADTNCIISQNGRCNECKPGYFVHISGKCNQLPPNCNIANFQTGECLQCVPDFIMSQPGAPCQKVVKIQNCEVLDAENPGKCLICVYKYFPDGNKCSKVSELCQDHHVQTGECLSCANPAMQLINGKCIDPNCLEPNGNTCKTCKTNFTFNQNSRICQFVDPNCDNLSTSACVQCKRGFYLSQGGTCKGLPANCESANNDGYCSICFSGYTTNNGACVQQLTIPNCLKVDQINRKCIICAERYFISGNACSRVNEVCELYNPQNGDCMSCRGGLILQGTVCQSQNINNQQNTPNIQSTQNTQNIAAFQTTSNNQINQGMQNNQQQFSDPNCREYGPNQCIKCSNNFYVSSQGKCVPVNPLCRTSKENGKCDSCYQGYALLNGNCGIAVVKDPNCKTPNGQGCSECYSGFYYSSSASQCKRVNPLCKTSNLSNGHCMSCYPGYQLNPSAGTCEVFFRDPNCQDFSSEGNCQRCATRYYLSGSKCAPVNPLCKDYDQSSGFCTSCYPGYVVNEGRCVVGAAKDPNCQKFEGDYCVQCYNGFFSQNGKCKSVSPLCKTFDKSNGYCTSCYPGYENLGGKCLVTSSKDPNCKKFDQKNSNYCVQCYGGYMAFSGKCKQNDPLCKTTGPTGLCDSCWQGYSLISGKCEIVSQQNTGAIADPYCVKAQGSNCIECSQGYFLNNALICEQLDPMCKTHNMSNGKCESCYQGFTFTDGKCESVRLKAIPNCFNTTSAGLCVGCIDGYYLQNNECLLVSILCATHNKNTGECTSCISGHYLQDGKCIFPAIYDANCIRYENSFCSTCIPGYFVDNYFCTRVDNSCASFDYNSNTCLSCGGGKTPSGPSCK